MNIPKVKFTDIALSREIDMIQGFLFQDEFGWGKHILRKHPGIEKVFSFEKEDEQVRFLKKYITLSRKENYEIIEKNKIRYETEWQKVEKDFFQVLSEIIQIDWPEDKKTIKAMISLNPICPRFLDEWSFSIFFDYKKISHAIEVIMHESCHFLYFEKWKEMYPHISKEKFESPHLEWHLSEIIAPIVLNDKRIRTLLKQEAFFYEEHQKMKINGKSAPEYFSQLYAQSHDFENFLDKSYEVAKKHGDLWF